MNRNSESLPQLKTSTRRVLTDLNSRPDFGKGIIYRVEWGFRLDKSSSYGGRGQYVGLTVQTLNERIRQHIKSASSLAYDDGVVSGSDKTKGDNKSPRMFYLALRVAMGKKNNLNIEFNKDYRVIKAIKHVNLFDLAYEEIKEIGGKIVGTSYSRYSDYVRSGIVRGSSENNPAPFNETEGGEGNKINKGYPSKKEQVMAALLFIKEGRGSTEPMRSIVGIGKQKKDKDGNMVRNTVAEDVRAVLEYFKKRATGFERLNAVSPTKDTIPGIMKELGVGELIGENLIVSSDKVRMINITLRYGETKEMDLDKVESKNIVKDLLSPSGNVQKLNISVKHVNKKEARAAAAVIKESGILKILGEIQAYFILQSRIRKKHPTFNLVDQLYPQLRDDHDGAVKKLLADPLIKKFKDADRDEKKKQRMDRKRNQQK